MRSRLARALVRLRNGWCYLVAPRFLGNERRLFTRYGFYDLDPRGALYRTRGGLVEERCYMRSDGTGGYISRDPQYASYLFVAFMTLFLPGALVIHLANWLDGRADRAAPVEPTPGGRD